MPEQYPADDLGPYPQADRNSTLQRLSIRALNNALPEDRFLFRREAEDDYGVDGELELLNSGRALNLRSKIQLKATDSTDVNSDGSVSLSSLKPSNLQYLLNGLSPLYILYIEPKKELRFTWARDERQRIEAEKPNWREQGTITLRFQDILTPGSLDIIYNRIRDEARLTRKTLEILARIAAATSDTDNTTRLVSVAFDPVTLAVVEPAEMLKTLNEIGKGMVAAGYGGEVLGLFDQLPPITTRTAYLQSVRAYAYFSIGYYMDAQAAASQSLRLVAQGNLLEDNERSHLAFIQRACDFHSGKLTLTQYADAMSEWDANGEQETESFSIAHRLDALRYGYLEEQDEARKTDTLRQLRELVGQVLAMPDASSKFKLDARLSLLYVEGAEVAAAILMSAASSSISRIIGRSAGNSQMKYALDAVFKWEHQAAETIEDARTQAHPLLYAEALTTKLTVRISELTTMAFAAEGEPSEAPTEVLQPLKELAEEAAAIFKRAGNLQGELHAKLRMADLFELGGQTEAAKAIARGVLPFAQAMAYTNVIDRAQEHISGTTMLAKRSADWAAAQSSDTDVVVAAMTDKEIHQTSLFWLRVREIPVERLPVVKQEREETRRMGQERLTWCRHLKMLHDLTHTQRPETYYLTPPNRKCHCSLLGYESANGRPQWEIVLNDFKTKFCQECTKRSPKNATS